MRLVLATGNAGKMKEFKAAFADLNINIVPQNEFKIVEADETGLSYIENALIKARHAAQCTGLPALADDSGVEVEALGGAPGIYSARYAGEKASAEENNTKLLQVLGNNPQRKARFQCVLVYLQHALDPNPLIFQGTWEGEILYKPQGTNGFGYEPLLFLPEYQCSAAEIDMPLKNRISHRGQAIQQLRAKLLCSK